MSYLGVGSFLLALFAGAGPGAPATAGMALVSMHAALAAPAPVAMQASKTATSPSPTPAPAALSASPVLTQQSSDTWITTIYLNTAALCPTPSFDLVTTTPDHDVPGKAVSPLPKCKGKALASKAAPVTTVQLTFGPLAAAPVTAAVVVTPGQAGVAPLQITVAVHRQVSWWQYAWVPLFCGFGLALMVVLTMWLAGLPDPDTAPAAGQRRDRIRGKQFWNRPLYAPAAWTFGGSWATNVTAGGTVIAAVLTATGTVSELLPGVELGRFSLLIAVAGGITVAAPLVFGALNYRFQRLDPTTLGVSVITLPAVLPDAAPLSAEIVVPAGATITMSGRVIIPAVNNAQGAPGADGTELPGNAEATLTSGATLAVPPGATISVWTPPPPQGHNQAQNQAPALAVPGTTDIAVFADQLLAVNSSLTVAATSIFIGNAHPGADRTLRQDYAVTVSGGAKISFLGRAGLKFPAGTTVGAPSYDPLRPARSSPGLLGGTVYRLPHTGQVIASQIRPLMLASVLTLFGTGAELGILGVLALSLSSASLQMRVLSVVAAAVAGAIVWIYSVVSITALADPKPGDALNATNGSSFML